ncbi:hypothetical protein IAU60_000535 [Kwoniella sp. DSM 27419]
MDPSAGVSTEGGSSTAPDAVGRHDDDTDEIALGHEAEALDQPEAGGEDSQEATIPSSPTTEPRSPQLVSQSDTSPSKPPSKVRAAAAMFESHSSPSSSFRSIPVTSGAGAGSKLSPGPHSAQLARSPSPSRSLLGRERSRSPRPPGSPISQRGDAPATPPASLDRAGGFSDVPLSTSSPDRPTDGPGTPRRTRGKPSTSPAPPPADLTDELPEPVTTPPAKEPVKSSFFSSALGLGYSGVSTTTEPVALSTAPSTGPSAALSMTETAHQPTGWFSSLLPSRSGSSTCPDMPETPAAGAIARPAESLDRQPSGSEGTAAASFLLHRVDSTTASRDRRISAQLGGGQAIREGFERVRGEMESAAREMRRERESRAALDPAREGGEEATLPGQHDDEEKVDWTFWGAVVQDFEDVARNQPKELSKAIQQGIPQVIRGAIWQLMSSSKSTPLEETYKALLKLPSPHEKAIVKDLNRTFPNHKYFQEGGGVGQESLFMVVKAYSLYDPEVGYTQGLAFIVAALLLNMPDEEAFCVLVRLMDSYNLRSHYTAEMQGLQLRLFQFDRLVEEILPLLHTHLVRKGVKSSIYAAQWFMTLFSYRFPLSLVYRVLDIVFAEGIEAIFRFSLALLQKSEDKLLELEFEQILKFFQSDLFEVYRTPLQEGKENPDPHDEEQWSANDFVRDAYTIRITPFMLDSYASEWEEQQRSQHRHAAEVDQLRNANRNLSSQVKQLESSLATMNQEHVDLVRQLVMSKIEKEETENELVRYKMLYAELAHAQQDAMSNHSRRSGGSTSSHSRA